MTDREPSDRRIRHGNTASVREVEAFEDTVRAELGLPPVAPPVALLRRPTRDVAEGS